jgi:putative lipoprotein
MARREWGWSLALVLAAAQALAGEQTSLVGTSWVATELGTGPLTQEDPPRFRFREDGKVEIFGGCNNFHGKVVMADESPDGIMRFPDPMAGTMMACSDPVGQTELQLMLSLRSVARHEVRDDILVLRDTDGAAVVRLRRNR